MVDSKYVYFITVFKYIFQLSVLYWSIFIVYLSTVTDVRGCQERGDDELLLNTLIFTQNAGEQVHTKGNDVNTGQRHWEH